jgi:hypothetical protein
MKPLLLIVSLFTFCAVPGRAQNAAQPQNAAAPPTITFDLNWEAATPQNYTILMDANGQTHYVSRSPTRPPEGSEEPDPDYSLDFTMSPANRDRILQLAKELNYFNGDFDFKQHQVANTGRKTLTYADSARNFHTTYNWSENKSLERITRLFQGISNTVEHGRKLQFMRRFNKLGLAGELKAMEAMFKADYLAEIQIIAPLLQSIADDPSILHMARQSAGRLLIVLNP